MHKISQEKIVNWFQKNTSAKYDLQARHLARVQGWDVRSGNKRFTVGVIDIKLLYNELRLHSLSKPNPIWLKEKQNKKRLKTLKGADWYEILNIFSERGCAVCGRFFKNYDQGHILRSKSHENMHQKKRMHPQQVSPSYSLLFSLNSYELPSFLTIPPAP